METDKTSSTSSNSPPPKNLNFTIFELLKQGLNPAKISKKLGISKTKVQFYIGKFKKEGKIEKVGYGTWEVKTSSNAGVGGLALEVRGHGFAFRIPILHLKNWDKRKELLEKRGIPFEIINNGVIRLRYKGHKVWLCNSSIIIYFPQDRSFMAETSEKAREQAEYEFKLLCNGFFRLIGMPFNKFEYEIMKHHYSLMGNALAKDYGARHQKLILEAKGKVWGLIDNSLNLHEFETISKTADTDNKKVQALFNDIKEKESFLPSEMMVYMGKTTQQVGELANNQLKQTEQIGTFAVALNKHIPVYEGMRQEVKFLHDCIKKLSQKIDKLK